MAFVTNAWYTDFGNGTSTGYYAVTQWSATNSVTAGTIRRQLTTPTVNNERVFICVVAGTTGSVEPTWIVTRGALTTDNTVTWQECTGQPAVNGDATYTPTWDSLKASTANVTLGQIIKNNSGTSYQICTVTGNIAASEPSFSGTAGVTTVDSAATWTSLGVVGNYTGWAAPHARLRNAGASTWGTAGNKHFVANTHAETTSGSFTCDVTSTLALPSFVICVNKLNVPPTSTNISSGATFTSTGSGTMSICSGTSYVRWEASSTNGFIFTGGNGTTGLLNIQSSGFAGYIYFKNCSFRINGNNSSSGLYIGINGSQSTAVIFDNCNVQCLDISNILSVGGSKFIWKNTAAPLIGGTYPTNLFSTATNLGATHGSVLLDGLNLSVLGSGKTLIAALFSHKYYEIRNCILGSSVTVAGTPQSPASNIVILRNSDSGNTNYRLEKYSYSGTQTTETTIVRTNGSSDGTTPISWKIVTGSTINWFFPYESIPITIWNDRVSSDLTLTLYGIWGSGAVPNNDEIWMEAMYLGNASYPLGTIAASTKANILATGSALSSDSSTWGGSTTKFKMTVSFTSPQPLQKGMITVYIKAAKASSTFYVDPLIVVS